MISSCDSCLVENTSLDLGLSNLNFTVILHPLSSNTWSYTVVPSASRSVAVANLLLLKTIESNITAYQTGHHV